MLNVRIILIIYIFIFSSSLFGTNDKAFALPPSYLSYIKHPEDGEIQLAKYKNRGQTTTDGKTILNQNFYHQNVGVDPAGWLLGGQALDEAASALARPYNEHYGYHSVPRNYIYYDWGW